MFEKLITQVLNKVLGDFIENIDPGQLSISITNGDVKLENMKLKASLFNSMPVPFQLIYGQVGLIHLKIPVWNMFKSPLVIEIENVFGIIRPKRIDEWSEEVEVKNFKSNTQAVLDRYEVFQQNAESLKKKDPSTVDKLLVKIIDNLQISIKNVYFRYEDEYSAPKQGSGKFAMGILLKELSAFTTNEEWKEKEMVTGSDITFKLGLVKGLTVFLDYDNKNFKGPSLVENSGINYEVLTADTKNQVFLEILKDEFDNRKGQHKYILNNFQLEARLKINKNATHNQLPQIDLDLILGGKFKNLAQNKDVAINFAMYQPQIMRILKLVEYIGYYNEFQSGALSKFTTSTLDNDVAKQYVALYTQWKIIEVTKKAQKEIDAKREEMKQIEDQYSYEKLVILRKFAMKLVEQQATKIQQQEAIDQQVQKLQSQKKGWGLFTSKEKKEAIKNEVDIFRQKLQGEMTAQLDVQNKDLDFELSLLTQNLSSQDVLMTEDFQKMPSNYIRFFFRVSLPSLRLTFNNEFEQQIFIAEIENCNQSIQIGSGITKFRFSLGQISLQDRWTQSEHFPKIIETKSINPEGNFISQGQQSVDGSALIVDFESNKEFEISPFKVHIETTMTLFIIANFSFIKEVQRSFKAAFEGETLDFTFYKMAATETAIQYMRTGKELLEQIKLGEYTHQALDISIYLSAPIFLIPQNIFQPQQPCLVIDTGILDVKSILTKYQEGTDYSKEQDPNKIYDRYEAKLEKIQISILEKGLLGLDNYIEGDGTHLIKNFDASLYVFNCFEPMHEVFPTLELTAVIENIHIQFGLSSISNILQIVNIIQNTMDAKEFQYFDQSIEDFKLRKQDSQMDDEKIGTLILNKITEYRHRPNENKKENEEDNQDAEDLKKALIRDNKEFYQQLEKAISKKDVKALNENLLLSQNASKLPRENTTGLKTNFKIYMQVQKFQVTMMEEVYNEKIKDKIYHDFLDIMLDTFEMEIEIDRKGDTQVHMTVLKFIIEDIQRDANIAKPFRMLLSSPMVESNQQKQEEEEQNEASIKLIKLHQEQFKKFEEEGKNEQDQRIMNRSLVTKANLEDYDGFQDAVSSFMERVVNEFELKVFLTKGRTDVDCNLTDLKLSFCVPTGQKAMKTVIDLERMLIKLDKQIIEDRFTLIELYKKVLDNIGKVIEQTREEDLIKKVFINHSLARGIDPKENRKVYEQGIQKMKMIWEKIENEEIDISIESEKEKEQQNQKLKRAKTWINRKLKTKFENSESQMNIKASLNNFSIWIPLRADNDKSQVLSLSFISSLNMETQSVLRNEIEQEFKEIVGKEVISSQSQLVFSLTHFTIEMLTHNEAKRFYSESDDNEKHEYISSQLLTPCRISLSIDGMTKLQESYSKNNIKVLVEPMHLKVGFKDIDFLNLVYVQIENNVLNQLKDKNKEVQNSEEQVNPRYHEELKLEEEPEFFRELSSQKTQEIKHSTIRREAVQTVKNTQQHLKKKTMKKKERVIQLTYNQISVNCELITLSLNDDTEQVHRSLIHGRFQSINFELKQNDRVDDEATFYLNKLGVNQKLHSDYSKEMKYLDMTATLQKFLVNYYNPKSLAFEPLIEPWEIYFKLDQLAPYLEQVINVVSTKMLNINLTFGMALTVRRIMDRVQESLRQAQILEKLSKEVPLTVEEMEFQDRWNTSFMKKGKTMIKNKENQIGFIFQNYSGLPFKFTIHDDKLNDELINTQTNTSYEQQQEEETTSLASHYRKAQPLTLERVYDVNEKDINEILFKSFDELNEQQREITIKRGKGKATQIFDSDPLKIDIKLNQIQKLEGIPIEGLGVHSYIANIVIDDLDKVSQSSKAQSKIKKKILRKIGVVVNIKMEGLHKRVCIESQLLIVNNNSREITIFTYPRGLQPQNVEYKDKISIERGGIFRAPLTWFTNDMPLSLYVEGKVINYKLFGNIAECFTYKHNESKILSDNAMICRIDDEFYTVVDVQGFKCLPEIPEDGPLQYIVSFDPPLKVTNYNFCSMDIRDGKLQSNIFAAMAPKETAFLNHIDTLNGKENLMWTFYQNPITAYQHLSTGFSVKDHFNETKQEIFVNPKGDKNSKKILLNVELKQIFYQEVPQYDENFEFRTRKFDMSIAAHLMIFPRFMVVNKTQMPFISSDDQVIKQLTNDYFNVSSDKVKFKVQGYKQSPSFDVTTIGLAGSFELDLDKPQDVLRDRLPHQYIPQKLEYGIKIQSAPTPFNKTTIITIVPRYVIVNELGLPVVIKQQGNNEQLLVQGLQTPFSLSSKLNKLIIVRDPQKQEINAFKQGKKLFDDLAKEDTEEWSSPFSVEDVDDFQISYPAESVAQIGQNNWFDPSTKNRQKRYARVIITSQDDATILIVLCNPLFPEYEITNKTNFVVRYGQMQESLNKQIGQIKKLARLDPNIIGSYNELQVGESQSFVWTDKTKPYRRLVLKVGDSFDHFNIDKALKRKEFTTAKGEKFNVEVKITGNAKKIKIYQLEKDKENLKQSDLFQKILKKYSGQSFTLEVQLKGLGLSFVDDQPKELLFLSIYNLNVYLRQFVEMRADASGLIETITDLKLSVQHLQLDNMINQIMPVVLAPTKPLTIKNENSTQVIGVKKIKDQEESKEERKAGDLKYDIVSPEENDETPFIQLNISKAESTGKNQKNKVMRLRSFQFAIQEFIFQIETSIINNNLKFVEELIHVFIDQNQYSLQLANYENFEKNKLVSREQICILLNADNTFMPDDSIIQSAKIFMEYIHLGAIKAIVTFKLEKQAFEIDISNPQKGFGILGLVYTLASAVASISNSNLVFKELIILDTFASSDTIIKLITRNYTRQGVRQFYKILGSSDIIGNPLGLVDKLGTGVIEFFNEPRKGLLKGPEEFVGGIGKGVKSLATNVVSGSFDSVSRITGSLYTVIKNVSGEEKVELKKPDHVFDGVYQGVKGGVSELVGGFTGIFTKPIQKTQQEGAKGFFKGVGSGLLGAISAPVTATLRIGSSITQGVASTANSLGNYGKVTIANIQHTRFRPPRYINTKNILENYNEDLALVSQSLQLLSDGKYATQSIKFFTTLPETKANGEIINKKNKEATVLLITDEMILYIKEEDKTQFKSERISILFKCKLRKIQKCEVFKQSKPTAQKTKEIKEPESLYILQITWYTSAEGQNIYRFVSSEYPKFERIYNILSLVPEVEAEDRVRQAALKAFSKFQKTIRKVQREHILQKTELDPLSAQPIQTTLNNLSNPLNLTRSKTPTLIQQQKQSLKTPQPDLKEHVSLAKIINNQASGDTPSGYFFSQYKKSNLSSKNLGTLTIDNSQLNLAKAKHAFHNKSQLFQKQRTLENHEIDKQFVKDYQKFQRNLEKIDLELANYAFQQTFQGTKTDRPLQFLEVKKRLKRFGQYKVKNTTNKNNLSQTQSFFEQPSVIEQKDDKKQLLLDLDQNEKTKDLNKLKLVRSSTTGGNLTSRKILNQPQVDSQQIIENLNRHMKPNKSVFNISPQIKFDQDLMQKMMREQFEQQKQILNKQQSLGA